MFSSQAAYTSLETSGADDPAAARAGWGGVGLHQAAPILTNPHQASPGGTRASGAIRPAGFG